MLADVSRVLQARRLYGTDHPATLQATDKAGASLAVAMRGSSKDVALGVSRDGFLSGEDEFREPAEVAEFASLLHRLNIGSLRLSRKAKASDLSDLCEAIERLDRDEETADAARKRIIKATGGRAALVPMSFAGLELVEGSRDPTQETRRGTWDELVRALLTGDPNPGSNSQREAARSLSAQVTRASKAELRSLRKDLRVGAGRAVSANSESRERVSRRVARFVESLDARTRKRLLDIDHERPHDSVWLLAEAGDAVSGDIVADTLRDVAKVAGAPSRETMMLMRRIVSQAGRTPDERADLIEAFARWGQETGDSASGEKVREALIEMMNAGDDRRFSPEDYQGHLHEISGAKIPITILDACDEIEDAQAVRAHASQIARALIESSAGDERGQVGLFRRLEATAIEAATGGQAGTLLKALEYALDAISSPVEEDLEFAAAKFIDRLRSDEVVDLLVRTCMDEPEKVELLELLGPRVVPVMVRSVAEVGLCSVSERLAEVLARADDAARNRSLIGLRAERVDIRALSLLFGQLGDEALNAMLLGSLRQPDDSMRMTAYLIADRINDEWPLDLCTRALTESPRAANELGLKRLCRHQGPRPSQILVQWMTGRLTGIEPTRERLSVALDLLERANPGDLRVPCASLRWLAMRPTPKNARIASRLASLLTQRSPDRRAKGCLWFYRLSLVRLINVLAGSDESGTVQSTGGSAA